jgi:hypothetical protein
MKERPNLPEGWVVEELSATPLARRWRVFVLHPGGRVLEALYEVKHGYTAFDGQQAHQWERLIKEMAAMLLSGPDDNYCAVFV